MVRTLAEKETPCPCKAICVPVAKSTQSHHWRVLRDSGLILQTERGRARLTELRRDDLDARFPGLLTSVLHALSSDRA